MKQFYELYAGNEKASTVLTQLSWSNHLLIMSSSKIDEEREFYIHLAMAIVPCWKATGGEGT